MALFKEKISDNGIISKYHNIATLSLGRDNMLACYVNSYANKEYRDNEAEPVQHQCYYIHITIEEEESMGIRKLAYTKLKELDEWKDAEDC